MKIKTICPGSCGELLQGEIGDGEKLISYAVNRFTRVILEEGKYPVRDPKTKKSMIAMYKTLDYFGERKEIGDQLSITIDSDIPVEKGMASSTGDIAATIVATAKLLDKELSQGEIGRICAGIEPTDSTLFKNLTLFDHLNGRKIKDFHWKPRMDILVLEPYKRLNTQEFRKGNYNLLRKENKNKVQIAYEIFEKAYKTKDIALLGKAATISSLANQNILPKEKLEDIIEISLKFGCFGVNVAHSGTVIGIILDKNRVDPDSLIKGLKGKSIESFYHKIYFLKMIEGGVRILDKNR